MKSFVNHLYRVPAARLRQAVLHPERPIVAVPNGLPWERIPIVPHAKLEVDDKLSKGVHNYTSKLTATIDGCTPPADTTEPQAWLAICTDGRRMLVGLDYRPYPVATCELSMTAPGGASAYTITIQWAYSLPALQVKSL